MDSAFTDQWGPVKFLAAISAKEDTAVISLGYWEETRVAID